MLSIKNKRKIKKKKIRRGRGRTSIGAKETSLLSKILSYLYGLDYIPFISSSGCSHLKGSLPTRGVGMMTSGSPLPDCCTVLDSAQLNMCGLNVTVLLENGSPPLNLSFFPSSPFLSFFPFPVFFFLAFFLYLKSDRNICNLHKPNQNTCRCRNSSAYLGSDSYTVEANNPRVGKSQFAVWRTQWMAKGGILSWCLILYG